MEEKEPERTAVKTVRSVRSRPTTPGSSSGRGGAGSRPGSGGSGAVMRSIEKKNKQLNNATKELEEKMKNLRQKTQQRALPKVRKTIEFLLNSLPLLFPTSRLQKRTHTLQVLEYFVLTLVVFRTIIRWHYDQMNANVKCHGSSI